MEVVFALSSGCLLINEWIIAIKKKNLIFRPQSWKFLSNPRERDIFHILLPVCFWVALSSFLTTSQSKNLNTNDYKQEIFQEMDVWPISTKGKHLDFISLIWQSHKTQLKGEPLKLSNILFQCQLAINTILLSQQLHCFMTTYSCCSLSLPQ